MKRTILFLCLMLTLMLPTACVGPNESSPSRVKVTVLTLKVVGASVDSSMRLAAQLLRDGKITRAQWDAIAQIHDQEFQPAFRAAVGATQRVISSSPDPLDLLADPAITEIAGRIAALITRYQDHTHP